MATLILPPGAGEVCLRMRLTPLPDGSTAVDIDVDGAAARRMIRLADAARSMVDPALDADLAAIELDTISARIRRAVKRGVIRARGREIDHGDFEAWRVGNDKN